MSRFVYETSTPIGQMVSESINHMQEALAKITRCSQSITLMDEEQMTSEIGVPKEQQAGFKSGLNQLRAAMEKDPFNQLLPNYDQG